MAINNVLTELLIEIEDICRECGVKYAVIGKAASSIIQSQRIDEEVVEPVVLMTGKDLNNFINAVEINGSGSRAIEYFGNSDQVNGLAAFYCDPNTTFMKLSSNGDHMIKGIRVRIEPLRIDTGKGPNKEAQKLEVGWLCRENTIRAHSSRDRWQAYRNARAELAKGKSFAKELYQTLCLTEDEGKTYVVDDLKKRFIERDVIESATSHELGTGSVLCAETKPLMKENIDSKELLISAEIPFTEYEKRIADGDVNLTDIVKLQQRSKFWHMLTKDDDKEMDRAWEKVQLSGDRLELLQAYEGKIKNLIRLREDGKYEELEKELAPHEEAVKRQLSRGLGLMVHPDLLELQLEVFARRGEKELIEKIQALIPEGHKRPIL